MWRKVWQRLRGPGMALLCLLWFAAAVAIATGPLGVEPERRNLWVVGLIFLAPLALVIAADPGERCRPQRGSGRAVASRAICGSSGRSGESTVQGIALGGVHSGRATYPMTVMTDA